MGVRIEGTAFVIARMEKFAQVSDTETKIAVNKAAIDIHRAEKKYLTMKTNRGTGKLVNSILLAYVDANTRLIEPLAEYAPYIEYGTRPHIIRARNKRVLAAKVKGARRKGVGQYTFFGDEVQHPGTSARPFVEPARAYGERQLEKYMNEALDKALK